MKRIIIRLKDQSKLALPDTPANRVTAVALVDQLMAIDTNYLRGDYNQDYLVEDSPPENFLYFAETLNREEWEFKCKQHEERIEQELKDNKGFEVNLGDEDPGDII